MCDSCPTCPECGRTVPEWPTAEYIAGLLLPPLVAIVLVMAAFRLGFFPFSGRFYWFVQGMFVMGTVMLIQTDQHIRTLVGDLGQ